MHPQLDAIAREFRQAQDHLHRLTAAVPAERWNARPAPTRWSVAECVAHLNLTARGFKPEVERALAEGRASARGAPPRYRRDPLGWFLWRVMAPPVRLMRVKTAPAFVASMLAGREELVAEFDRLQEEQIGWVAAADGLDLARLRVSSPFDARAKYNLYSCLSILPRHQERHIWQAEQSLADLGKVD